MVVIGYDYKGTIISIVNAKSLELANAYWQGADIIPHSYRSLDDESHFTPLNEHPTGVYPLLKAREMEGYQFRDYKGTIRIITK